MEVFITHGSAVPRVPEAQGVQNGASPLNNR